MNFHEQSIIKLADLSYADVNQLAAWCREAVAYDSPRHKTEQDRWRKQAEAAEAKRRAQAAPKAAKEAAKLRWLLDNLKEGNILKMVGCRDGHGYREFIRWTPNNNLVCWQMEAERSRGNYKVFVPASRGILVTTHMADKVSKIQLNGKFVPITS